MPCTSGRSDPHALLVEVDDAAAARSLAAWARAQELTADEVVPAARTVLFDGVPDAGTLREALADWQPGAASVPSWTWSRSR